MFVNLILECSYLLSKSTPRAIKETSMGLKRLLNLYDGLFSILSNQKGLAASCSHHRIGLPDKFIQPQYPIQGD